MDILTILEKDAIAIGEAIATGVAGGSGSATLQAIQAQVGGKTLDVTATINVSKASAPPKVNGMNDAIRLGEAFAQAFLTGTAAATLDAFGVNIAGTELAIATNLTVSAR